MHSKSIQAVFGILCLVLNGKALVLGSPACQRPSEKPFFALNVGACDPKPLIYDHEGCKECMYLDSKGIKTIAVGLNLRRRDAESILSSVGANYQKIVNGPATAVKTPCNCDAVTCLTQDQIDKILSITVEGATRDAASIVPSFGSLCCPVQNAVVDMSFTLGKTVFALFKEFVYWLYNENWKAAADDLRTTKWCQVEASRRCNADADTVQKGCGCTGVLTRSCDAISSSCCKDSQTCCKGNITFKNYITRTEDELLCCPFSNAVCCQQNKCCQPQYPICCLPDFCCAPGNRCISGQCYAEDGGPGQSMPASGNRIIV